MTRISTIGLLIITLLASASGQTTNKSGKKDKDEQQKAPPGASIAPGSLDFGDQVAKKPSSPQRITITNNGEKKLYINSAAVSGDNRADFRFVNDTCTGATIAAGKSCIIDVSFLPYATGRRKAAITITDNATDSPQTVPVTGNGINSADVPPSGRK